MQRLKESTNQLLQALQQDRLYFYQHKVFLSQALRWQRQDKNASFYLRGYNLQNAQAWLSIGNKREINRPLDIQTEFIDESAAHAGEQSIEVFISYSRRDGDFARKLNSELQINGKTTWFDQDNIAEGSDFQQEIYKGIENSENFLFLISEQSIKSPYCADEVEYAHQQGKRILSLLLEEVNPSDLPPALSAVQWMDATNDFTVVFSQLIRALDTDREHVHLHNRFQNEALSWQKKSQSDDLLLRGTELEEAQSWIQEAMEKKLKPFPTELQKTFLRESETFRKKIKQKERNRKVLIGFTVLISLGLIFSVFLMISAHMKFISAEMQRVEALEQQKIAEMASRNAIKQKQIADRERMMAEEMRQIAIQQQEKADSMFMLAKERADSESERASQLDLERIKLNQKLEKKMSKTQIQREKLDTKIKLLKKQRRKIKKEISKDSLKAINKRINTLEDELDQLSRVVTSYAMSQGWFELERSNFRVIDAAFVWPRATSTKAYFFFKDKYIRWDLRLNKMDANYPKRIKPLWPGVTFDRIDAAILIHAEQKVYFFRKDEFIRFDMATDKADVGYPKKLNEENWPGMPFRKIDAAFSWEQVNGTVYFMSGNQYARYIPSRKKFSQGYPKEINQNTWPEMTFKTITAAFVWNKDISYLFQRDEYHRWDNRNDRAY